ncbi:MAG: FecR domain-containing protein [Thermodesulfobacteria bacterium]|nr:FecR domain-containing protein [Thermodesulfobacteriota bacterium]
MNKKGRKISLLSFLVIVFVVFVFKSFALAKNLAQNQTAVGEVTKYKGRVVVKRKGEIRPFRVRKEHFKLFVGDCIKTKTNSKALILFIDGTKVLLDQKSVLCIQDYEKTGLKTGKVFFKVKKGIKGRRLVVSNILIGVKGTLFGVGFENSTGLVVEVKEGRVCVENLKGEFKKYEKKLKASFEEFKKQREIGVKKLNKEFEAYKKKVEKEFYEFVKKFELKPGETVSIINNEVKYIKPPKEFEEGFKLLEEW